MRVCVSLCLFSSFCRGVSYHQTVFPLYCVGWFFCERCGADKFGKCANDTKSCFVSVLVGLHISGGVKSNSHAQTYSHILGESTRKSTAVSRKSGNRKLQASKAMACEITNSTPLSATDDRLCVKCNEFFPVSCFMSVAVFKNRS